MISHQYLDSTERPIAFASRTLTASEHTYAQLEKEALALVYGVKQFHAYLYRRQFVLVTDHKPLLTILSPSHSIPPLAAAGLQRWTSLHTSTAFSSKGRRTMQMLMVCSAFFWTVNLELRPPRMQHVSTLVRLTHYH